MDEFTLGFPLPDLRRVLADDGASCPPGWCKLFGGIHFRFAI